MKPRRTREVSRRRLFIGELERPAPAKGTTLTTAQTGEECTKSGGITTYVVGEECIKA